VLMYQCVRRLNLSTASDVFNFVKKLCTGWESGDGTEIPEGYCFTGITVALYLVSSYHVVRLCGTLLLGERGAHDVYICSDLKDCTSSQLKIHISLEVSLDFPKITYMQTPIPPNTFCIPLYSLGPVVQKNKCK
jgi:hypothetical protein